MADTDAPSPRPGPENSTSEGHDANSLEPELKVEPPTESCAELAMRSRIAARLSFDIGQTIQRIGRYEVLRRLGAGGMGVVYEARDPELDRMVALKLLRAHLTGSRPAYDRLRQEARALAKLSHPNVVQIHEVAEHDGGTFVAMELVRGQTLHTWQRSQRRSCAEVLAVYRQAGLGLAAAHGAGIVHRDFKPSNVLIGDDGRIRVADFGLAHSEVDSSEDETRSGSTTHPISNVVVGTPGYIAPEILAGSPAGSASDQFSFCVALWEAICGERPAAYPTDRRARTNMRFAGPGWLRRVLVRGLAENPADRWPDLPTLMLALDRRPRWQRLLLLGLPMLGLGAGLLVQFLPAEPNDPCADLGRDFDKIWNPEVAGRLRTQLDGLERTTAEADLVERTLDRQRALWLDAERDVCEAARVDASWTPALQDAASRCLDDVLEQTSSLIALLDVAAGEPPASIQGLVAQLDDPRHCVDLDALAGVPASNPSPAVASLRRAVARGRLLVAGETARSDAESERLLGQAREIRAAEPDDWQAELVLAEALELRAAVEDWRQRPELAWPLLREATPIARRHRAVELELRCLHHMGVIAAERLEDPDRGADFVALAEGLLESVESNPRSKFDHALLRTEVARAREQFSEAEAILTVAIHEAKVDRRIDGASLFRARLRFANVVAEQGRTDAAVELYVDLRDSMAAELGPDSADIGIVEVNLGLTLYEAGENEQAALHLHRALALLERTFGSSSVRLAPSLTVLAEIQFGDGQLVDALRDAERAWALQREQLPPRHGDYGEPLKVISGVQLTLGDHEAALATFEEMAEVLATDSVDERAGIECSRGWLMCRLGRCDAARPHFEAAIAQPTATNIQYCAAAGLASVDIVDGRPQAALQRLDQLVEQLQRDAVEDPTTWAEVEWLLARALADSGAKPKLICAHVERALSAGQALPKDIAADLAALGRGCN